MSAELLLVDDDDRVREYAESAFAQHGYELATVSTTAEARRWLERNSPDVILLDLVLPDGSGLELLREVRSTNSTQVIVLSGLIEEADRVLALEMGADDYVTKPFSMRELIARTRTALRRSQSNHEVSDIIAIGGLTIDSATHEVRNVADGTEIRLRKKEFDLLLFLAQQPKQVFSKAQILSKVWDAEPAWISDSTVTEHVRRLRLKLPEPVIETVWGVGYRLNPDLAK